MDENSGTLLNWVLGAIAALATAAAAAIRYLYNKTESVNAARITDLQDQVSQLKAVSTRCEDIRIQLCLQVTQLTAELTVLKSEHADLKQQLKTIQEDFGKSN